MPDSQPFNCSMCLGTGRNQHGGPCPYCSGTGRVRGVRAAWSTATALIGSLIVIGLVGYFLIAAVAH